MRTPLRASVARLLIALCLATAALIAAPSVARADNGSPTNDAVAVNTKDGSSVFKLAFSMREVSSSTVAPENAAVAYASCSNCQTVAIAVQIVFVVGSPDTFAPQNAAVAVNEQCTSCDTLATAYQFIVQSSVPVRLTNDGRHQVHDIIKALRDLEDSGLDVTAIQAKVDELMKQLANVLATEVEPIPGHGDDKRPDSPTSTTAPPTTVVTTTTTTSVGSVGATSTTTTTSTSTPASSDGTTSSSS